MDDATGNAQLDVGTLTEGDKITIAGIEYEIATATDEDNFKLKVDAAYTKIAAALTEANGIGGTGAVVTDNTDGTFSVQPATTQVQKALYFSLHVGADSDMNNKIGVSIETMNSTYLGINGINVKDDSGVKATYAIDAIAEAITKVSAQRAELGAVQNRLEHTISNLDNVVENTTAAESRIRDTDMAEEMVEYSKENILMQAGQSMLAQANQSTQGVLSLLQ